MNINHIISTSSGPDSIKRSSGKKTNSQPRRLVAIKRTTQDEINDIFKSFEDNINNEVKNGSYNPEQAKRDQTTIEVGIDSDLVKVLIYETGSIFTSQYRQANKYPLEISQKYNIQGDWNSLNKPIAISRLKSNIRDITKNDLIYFSDDEKQIGVAIKIKSHDPKILLQKIKIAFNQTFVRGRDEDIVGGIYNKDISIY